MKLIIIVSLCVLIAGCSDGNYKRGYVISKSDLEPEASDPD